MLKNILTNFWVIQGIGVIALYFYVFAFQGKERRQILYRQGIGALFFTVHYWFLFAYSGAVMSFVSAFRNYISEKKDKKNWAKSPVWFYFFMILPIAILPFFKQGWISILPVLGLMTGTYGVWRNKPSEVRFYMLITVFIWIIYTLIVKSYSGLITQIIIGTSIALGMYRHDRKKQ